MICLLHNREMDSVGDDWMCEECNSEIERGVLAKPPLSRRRQLTQPDFANAMEEVDEKLTHRVRQRGMGACASIHEIVGIIDEEVNEFLDEVHAKNNREQQVQELLDIAVAAIWGIASIRSGGVDW